MHRLALAAVMVAALVLPALPASAQYSTPPFTNSPGAVARVEGDTPAEYAVALSQQANTVVDTAVIVSDSAFADALSASALAGFGAIFFASPGQGLDDATLAEVDRIVSDTFGQFVIVGGSAAVDEEVRGQLDALDGDRPVIRLAGATRFETAIAVADFLLGDDAEPASYEVLVARAFGPEDNPTAAWADSVAAGPAAASMRTPILFTSTDELHPSITTWLEGRAPRRVTVLGGTAAISQSAGDAIDAPVRRVAGSSRDDTAARIFHQLIRDGYGSPLPMALVNLYDEQGWAYGLATAPVVGGLGGGILAVNPDAESLPTQSVLACARPTEVLVAGPTSLISDADVELALACPDDTASGPTDPLALRGDGLGADIDFGLGADATVEALTAALGAPTDDTGRVQPACELAGPDGPAGRYVTFAGGLTATFAEAETDEMFFDGWVYDGTELATPEGVRVGDTSRVLETIYGHDYILREGDPEGFPPPIGAVDTPRGPLDTIMSGNTPNDQVETLYGGGGLQFCE